jgi:hypothetical protein
MFVVPSCVFSIDDRHALEIIHVDRGSTDMANRDDEFQPRLGRIRDRKAGKTLPYIRRVMRTAERATGIPWRSRSFRFSGARIGRGRAHGTVAAGRHRQRGRRRVIIKTRVVRMRGADLAAAKAHLRYIQRDGVTPQGEPGRVYDASTDQADGKDFLERSAEGSPPVPLHRLGRGQQRAR